MALPVTDSAAPGHSPPMTAVPSETRGLSFEALYDAHAPDVWRAVRRLGVEPGAVDDVVQETFVTAWRTRSRFEGRSAVKTWLIGIALNHARHALRTQARLSVHQPVEAATSIEAGGSPDEALASRRRQEQLLSMLRALPEEQREVFVMMDLEGMSAPEVAELAGAPLNTVYSRLRLARAAINAAVERLEVKP